MWRHSIWHIKAWGLSRGRREKYVRRTTIVRRFSGASDVAFTVFDAFENWEICVSGNLVFVLGAIALVSISESHGLVCSRESFPTFMPAPLFLKMCERNREGRNLNEC